MSKLVDNILRRSKLPPKPPKEVDAAIRKGFDWEKPPAPRAIPTEPRPPPDPKQQLLHAIKFGYDDDVSKLVTSTPLTDPVFLTTAITLTTPKLSIVMELLKRGAAVDSSNESTIRKFLEEQFDQILSSGRSVFQEYIPQFIKWRINVDPKYYETILSQASMTNAAILLELRVPISPEIAQKYVWRIVKEKQPPNAALLSLLVNHADQKANPNVFENGITPLMWAAWNDDTQYVKILLDNGADAAALGPRDFTAAHYCYAAAIAKNLSYETHFVPVSLSLISSKLGVEPTKIIEDVEAIKWTGWTPPTMTAPASATGGGSAVATATATAHPCYLLEGHGSESITPFGERPKMKPNRILLLAAECGQYTYFHEVMASIDAASESEFVTELQNLYSSDKMIVNNSLKQIETRIGLKVRMFREGDSFPKIIFSLDTQRKSGVYKCPIEKNKFIKTETGRGTNSIIYPDTGSQIVSGAVFPTEAAFEKANDFMAPVLPAAKYGLMNVTLEEIMDKQGDGVYMHFSCRDIIEYKKIRASFQTRAGKYRNILNELSVYEATRGRPKFSELRKKIQNTRRASFTQQAKYNQEKMRMEEERIRKETEEANAKLRSNLEKGSLILDDSRLLSILGLSKGATEENIKKAYHKLAREHHPDKGGNAAKFVLIQSAYNRLTGKTRRNRRTCRLTRRRSYKN